MSDQTPQQEENLGAEFRAFGETLKEMLRAAWERPERQQFQTEIESALHELGTTLRQTAGEFSQSEVGQRMKTEAENLRSRVERGEVEKTVREDLGKALRTVNAELQKVTEKLRTSTHTTGEDA
ncbi:MAG TPA: hypothetical protein PK530_07985 [Anaerolineales bacterium]|nr:hypothetical protein [Anaerolineales bacterium]